MQKRMTNHVENQGIYSLSKESDCTKWIQCVHQKKTNRCKQNDQNLKCRKILCLLKIYSKVSNKRTVFNNRTGGDIILQKV